MQDLFQYSTDPLTAETAKWDLTGPLPVPLDTFNMACPACGADRNASMIQIRQWNFHEASDQNSTYQYRCAISFKCRACSHVFFHGLVVPDSMALPYVGMPSNPIRWREGEQLLLGG